MKVGVFDSGVGGLTVLRAIRERYPKLDIVYLGDTARVPYGNKSRETVIRYSLECAEFLASKGIDLLVVACNTASSQAIDALRNNLRLPVVGVVEPGVKVALSVSKGKVGVIGTLSTVESGVYQRPLEEAGLEVYSKACPLFVPLVEEGLLDGELTQMVVSMYLGELKDRGIDTLILGCTHYPLLRPAIEKFLPGVYVVDSSEAVARELEGLVCNEGEGDVELFFTDRSPKLDFLVRDVLGLPFEVRVVNEGVYRP